MEENSIRFLLMNLQLIAEHRGNPQKIYPVWEQQQNHFDEGLLTVLTTEIEQFLLGDIEKQVFLASTLGTFGNLIQSFPLGRHWLNLELSIAAYQQAMMVINQTSMPTDWATAMNNLANAYAERIRGDRAENLEMAVNTYKQALTVRTQEAMPVMWAQTTNNLATVYVERIRGDRAENLEMAINAYQEALKVRVQKTMPVAWAGTMHNLATAYSDRIRGDRAENIEAAISAYQQVLTVRTQEAMPVDWAATVMNLATAYAERIRGDRAENLEASINACQQALKVRTQETMPVDWAATMMNLAAVYYSRIRGDRAENLEAAISAYQQSLTVRTQEDMPADWALTMMNLALAYAERIRGDRAENLEAAISAYQQALKVRTQESMPMDWALTMNNLAIAYAERIQGNREENLEVAISAYQQSLTVRTQEDMPVDWALTMMNLALAYAERTRGNRSENLEKAISVYQKVLKVRTQEAMPISWAQTMNNLAIAYSERIQGNREENLEKAVSAYQQALKVRTQEAMPMDWAQTMNNLAIAYSERIQGNREENLEKAISAYQQALAIWTQKAMPIDWAQATNNLAVAYAERIKGNLSDNVKQAIAAYRQALTVFKPELLPNDCQRTARSLANLYSDQQNWTQAAEIYQTALQGSEILYQSANLLDSKASVLSETADLPRRAAFAFSRYGNLSQAVETLDQSRARALSESLDRDRADLVDLQQIQPDLYAQYTAITEQLRNLESQQREQVTSGDHNRITPEVLRETATTLRQQLNILIQAIHQVPSYGDFLSLPTFEDVRQAVSDDCPLVYLLSTPNGSLALIVMPRDIQLIWLDGLKEEQLIELLNREWFEAYNYSQSNHQAWFKAIDSVTHQLWEPLMEPLIHRLKIHNFNQAILIPTGYLSLFPLHAAWTEDETRPNRRRYALDDIHFTYAPNAKSLTAARLIAHQIQPDSILAIDNPRSDLPNSEREVEAAVSGFSDHTLLSHQSATVAAVKTQLSEHTVVHFSCHGTANLTEPLNSGLLMHDGPLTLKDIFALNLAESGGLRLAILSACETGMIGIENADEAISLPTGLLQAGVAAVIASLWSVDDLSTMILLTRFYDLWRTEGLEISQALRQAQQWVRDTTNGEKTAYFKDFMPTQSAAKMPASAADHLYKSLILSRPDARDFAHPFHWAAFSYIGA